MIITTENSKRSFIRNACCTSETYSDKVETPEITILTSQLLWYFVNESCRSWNEDGEPMVP